MRVTYAAVLDTFACARRACACIAEKPNQSDDFPFLAVATPDGASLSVSTLCPALRQHLLQDDEPVSPAHAEGGWRQPLQLWRADDSVEVALRPGVPLAWPAFCALRDVQLELVADPSLPILARLTRLATVCALALDSPPWPDAQGPDAQGPDAQCAEMRGPGAPPLTSRAFLAFRAHLEARCASVDVPGIVATARRWQPLFPELASDDQAATALSRALAMSWRPQVLRWLVPAEPALLAPWQTWLGVRLLALPMDRGSSLARAWAELLEANAVAIRYASALGEVSGTPVSPAQFLAALALAEQYVTEAQQPLPLVQAPRDHHERGPRLADLDLTLEAIC